LEYEGSMKLLFAACSTYDKKISLRGKQKRAVYTTTFSDNDKHIPSNNSLDGEYEVFTFDKDVSDIMLNSTFSNQFVNRRTSGNTKPKSNFLPRDEWNKFAQEQKDQLNAKRRQEQMVTSHQANIHEVDDFVNIDDIVAYTTMSHDVTKSDNKDVKDESPNDNALLAYMAGCISGTSPGDIRQVRSANHAPNKNMTCKANKRNSAPSTL
jgi:hypothetical protein